MSKRTCVLTVIISSFLFLAGFFAVFYSRTVMAANQPSIVYYKDNNKWCFLPEKGTNLDGSGNMYNEVSICRNRDNNYYTFRCTDNSNKYTYDGDSGIYIFESSIGYSISYLMDGVSGTGYTEVKCIEITDLFGIINVDYSNDVFSADLSSVRKYAIFGDCSIEVKGIDPDNYYLSNDVLYIQKEGRVGWNDLEISFKKSDGSEFYCWRTRKKIVPSLQSATLDGNEITPDGLGITNGHHNFSIKVFQYNGCSSMELTITDITNGKRLCDSVQLSGSLGTYSGTFDIAEVPVDHKLSYNLVI